MHTATGEQHDLVFQSTRGLFEATVTEIGASLRQLTLNGVKVIEPYGPDQIPPHCAGVIMAPWLNRIDHGQWELDGKTLQLNINLHEQDNANHGLLMEYPYAVLEKSDSFVKLYAVIFPRAGYPFSILTTVKYELVENGMRVTQTAQNIGQTAAPYSTGGHPYLTIGGEPDAELVLFSEAGTLTAVNDRQIPIGQTPPLGTYFDMRNGVKLGEVAYDHDFTDLPRDGNGMAHTYLRSSTGEKQIDVWQDEKFSHLVLFTPDFFPTIDGRQVNCVAIEPGTSAPNSFNNQVGLIWLEPKASFEGSWGINVDY